MTVLLYVGAGWDPFPITHYKELPTTVKTFVYVDALPNTPHYEPGQFGYPMSTSKQAMLDAMTREGGTIQDFTTGSFVEEDHYVLEMDGNRILHYFFNTEDTEMIKNKILMDLINATEILYIQGYLPHASVYDILPNLKEIHSPAYLNEEIIQPDGTELINFEYYTYNYKKNQFEYPGTGYYDYPDYSDNSDNSDNSENSENSDY